MIRMELFQKTCQCTIIILFCLLQVTTSLYITQAVVRNCYVNTLRTELLQNCQCTIIVLFRLPQVTQVVVRDCNVNTPRTELLQKNCQCTIIVLFRLPQVKQVVVRDCNVNTPRTELLQKNCQCTIIVLFRLRQDTQVLVYISQVVVSACGINGQCTIVMLLLMPGHSGNCVQYLSYCQAKLTCSRLSFFRRIISERS